MQEPAPEKDPRIGIAMTAGNLRLRIGRPDLDDWLAFRLCRRGALLRQGQETAFLKVFEQPRKPAATRYSPFGVVQFRFSQVVLDNSLRLSFGSNATIFWMSANWRNVKRRPRKVVDLRAVIRGAMAEG